MTSNRVRRFLHQSKHVLKHEIQLVFIAWIYFMEPSLPAYAIKHKAHHQAWLKDSIRYLPLVGIISGIIGGLVFWAAQVLFASSALAVLLSMATMIVLTGARRTVYGLADLFGNLSNYVLTFMILVEYQSLILVPAGKIPWVLILGQAFSWFAAGSLLLPPRTSSSHASRHLQKTTVDCIVMCFIGMVPLLVIGNLLLLLLIPLLWIIRSGFGVWYVRGKKATTCAATTQQIIKICFYLLVVVALQHPA